MDNNKDNKSNVSEEGESRQRKVSTYTVDMGTKLNQLAEIQNRRNAEKNASAPKPSYESSPLTASSNQSFNRHRRINRRH